VLATSSIVAGNATWEGQQVLHLCATEEHEKWHNLSAYHNWDQQSCVRFYPDDPEMRDVYEEELRRLRLRAVLLDEAQHLITSGDGKQPKDQLNWIKSMAIETGVLHVLIGTYDLLPFCNLDGQMARRGSEFHFARYHMEDENDCQESDWVLVQKKE
jgi:hypothetical protein